MHQQKTLFWRGKATTVASWLLLAPAKSHGAHHFPLRPEPGLPWTPVIRARCAGMSVRWTSFTCEVRSRYKHYSIEWVSWYILVANMGRLPHSFSPPPHSRGNYFLDVQVANGCGLVPPYSSSSAHSRTSSQYLQPVISPLRLTPQDDTTRVQLQRQRLKEQHATILVTKNIPGLKTSAGKFKN